MRDGIFTAEARRRKVNTIKPMEREHYDFLSKEILDSSITVHKEMGPGLLEAVYQHCLVKEDL